MKLKKLETSQSPQQKAFLFQLSIQHPTPKTQHPTNRVKDGAIVGVLFYEMQWNKKNDWREPDPSR